MGVIQSSINQMSNTAAIAGGLLANSPAGQRFAEKQRLNREEKRIQKTQQKNIQSNASPEDKASAAYETAEQQVAIAEKQAELNPTPENQARLQRAKDFVNEAATDEMVGVGPSPQEQAAIQAKTSKDNAIKAKRAQKRNFMDYLGKLDTNLGGKVGELHPAIQKQIAAQYSKNERKKLMNQMDKEEK